MANKIISFKVSEVFGDRNPNLVPQYFGDRYRNEIFIPNQNKVLTIPKTMSKLVDYKLPKNINDTAIQTETKSIPMDEDSFLIVLYLLIIKPEIGKELLGYTFKQYGTRYLFHVKMVDGTVRTVDVAWNVGVWRCGGNLFDVRGGWSAGLVFLHFATV